MYSYEDRMRAVALYIKLGKRPGELRQAEWSEFDLENAVWVIPAECAKIRRPHKKPLSPLAVEILAMQRNHTGNLRLVFPSSTSDERPISENTMNQALRRMGFSKDDATSHGFRATASTLLNESGAWNEDAIEAELAHIGGNAVRRAYHRASYWDERVKMTIWWSERSAEIVKNLEQSRIISFSTGNVTRLRIYSTAPKTDPEFTPDMITAPEPSFQIYTSFLPAYSDCKLKYPESKYV